MMHPVRTKLGFDKKISFVSGNFNVLHPGHLRLLRFAAEISDALVVGLNPDTTSGVSVSGDERLRNIIALDIVSDAQLLETTVEDFIRELKPDFVVKGKEFEYGKNSEAAVVKSYGGELIFSSGEMQFSSMALLNSEFKKPGGAAIVKPMNFQSRYEFDSSDLNSAVGMFSGIRLLVLGDLIIDEYITCEPLGMSQEDPTIVVSPLEQTRFVGGAGVVSAHASQLGAKVEFISVTGNDENAEFASSFFDKCNIGFNGYVDETRPTILKQRYRAHGKTLLRVNHLRHHPISHTLRKKILDNVESKLAETDLILFADFNYGCLPQSVVDSVSEMALQKGIPMAADSQASSQLSDISRFKNMMLVTPTEREARLALNDPNTGIAELASRLAEKSNVENVIVTLGAEGMLIRGIVDGEERTDRLPAFNHALKDPAGAGDSLFTVTSLALACGYPIWPSAYLGSIAAACQTARVGNAPLGSDEIRNEID